MCGGRERGSVRALLLATGALLALGLPAGCGDDDSDNGAQEGAPAEQAESPQELEEFIRADFEQVDADSSGTADRDEAEEVMRADFEAMDLDGDGVVTLRDVQQELDRSGGGEAGRSLSAHLPHDTDGDDRITEQEYLNEVFKQTHEPMDADGDGEIHVEEAVDFHTARARERR